MWQIIVLLLVVSVITLLMKPREPFTEITELDVYKGFNKDFDMTYDALREKDELVKANQGEFNTVKGDAATFDNLRIKKNLNVENGNLRVNTNGGWNWLHVHRNKGDDLYFGGDDTNRGIWSAGDRPFTIYTNGQNRVSVFPSGHTQINNTASIHTKGGWNWLRMNRSGNDDLYFGGDDTNRGIWSSGNRPVSIYTSGANRLSVAADGTVNIPNKLCVQNQCIEGNQLAALKNNTSSATDMTVKGKLFIGGTGTAPDWNANDTDPYYLEKVRSSGNYNTLRLTINDDANEAFEIWGNACGDGNCWGKGSQRHKFVANGDAEHKGNLTIGGTLNVNRINIGKRWTIAPEQNNEILVIRDKLTGGDKRIAFHPGQYRDFA